MVATVLEAILPFLKKFWYVLVIAGLVLAIAYYKNEVKDLTASYELQLNNKNLEISILKSNVATYKKSTEDMISAVKAWEKKSKEAQEKAEAFRKEADKIRSKSAKEKRELITELNELKAQLQDETPEENMCEEYVAQATLILRDKLKELP